MSVLVILPPVGSSVAGEQSAALASNNQTTGHTGIFTPACLYLGSSSLSVLITNLRVCTQEELIWFPGPLRTFYL